MSLNKWFQSAPERETGFRLNPAPLSRTSDPTKTGSLIPVCSGDALLTEHGPLIRQIAALAGVPDSHFEHLYLSALKAYAAFVQRLPVPQDHHTPCLDQTLKRLVRTLSKRQGYLLPAEAEPEVIAVKADLWTYTVFTVSLLQDIDQTVLDRHISLFDQDRRPLGHWNPFTGPMTATAAWYHIDIPCPSPTDPRNTNRHLAPLLARFILPPVGLNWLWGDGEALRHGLETLIGHSRTASILDEIIGAVSASSPP